jgi:hypothetical protein
MAVVLMEQLSLVKRASMQAKSFEDLFDAASTWITSGFGVHGRN